MSTEDAIKRAWQASREPATPVHRPTSEVARRIADDFALQLELACSVAANECGVRPEYLAQVVKEELCYPGKCQWCGGRIPVRQQNSYCEVCSDKLHDWHEHGDSCGVDE